MTPMMIAAGIRSHRYRIRALMEGSPFATAAQAELLYVLMYADEPISMSRFAAQVGAACSSMTVAVDRLERDGLVERVPNPADRRQWLLVPTEKARELMGSLPPVAV